MKTKDAINRLSYTIGHGNKPNETDKIAINSLISFINNSDAVVVQENALFAKLYTFVLTELTAHYKDVNFANKVLNNELKAPITHHIDKLKSKLKGIELDNFFKEKGIFDPFVIDQPFALEVWERNKSLFPAIDIKEMQEVIEMWEDQDVQAHLNRNINESFNTFKNV